MSSSKSGRGTSFGSGEFWNAETAQCFGTSMASSVGRRAAADGGVDGALAPLAPFVALGGELRRSLGAALPFFRRPGEADLSEGRACKGCRAAFIVGLLGATGAQGLATTAAAANNVYDSGSV